MAPDCTAKVGNFLLGIHYGRFPIFDLVDPASQNAPPVPAVPYRALLVRQTDCSVTRLVFDAGNQLLSSYPNYQDYLHQDLSLSSAADRFAQGCQDPTTGVASQFGASLGKFAGNYEIATLAPHGIQITVATPGYTIASTTTYAIGDPTILDATAAATADLNGDGLADLVVASSGFTFANPTGTLTVFLSKPDGTFQAPQTITLSFNVQGFTIDDLNADGKLDIVAVGYADINAGSAHSAILLGHGDGTFASSVPGPANVTGNAVVTGDFNGDGKKDLATSDGYILLGDGSGNFTAPFGKQFLTSGFSLAAGDFDHDGHIDLALATAAAAGTVDIYRGQGDGHFTRTASYATIYGAQSISTTDMDGDGNIDLFIGIQSAGLFSADVASDGEFHTLLGLGDGTFTGAVAINPTSAAGFSLRTTFDLGDVTGDQKPDLVFADSDTNGPYLSVLAGNGDTTFTPKGRTAVSGYALGGPLVIADFNHDGKNDVAFATGGGATAGLAISLGNGDGSFQPQVAYTVPAAISTVVAADLNGDGTPDLVFTTSGVSAAVATLQVMLNNGDGTFQPPQQIDAKAYQFFIAVADVNGDGKRDLLVTAPGFVFSAIGGSTTLYLGNGDGTFAAPVAIDGGVNPGPVSLVDMNGDGKLDVVIAGSASSSAGSVTVLFGKGDGTFQAAQSTPTGFVWPGSMATGDIDKDGHLDLVVTECCGLAYTWLLHGNGDGTFAGAAALPLGLGSGNARLTDLNGDGYPEIVVTSNQAVIVVFPNAGSTQAVIAIPTTTTLASSSLSIAAGNSLTLTATVAAASGTIIPGGSATFFDGSTAIGTAALDATGKATFATTTLTQGNHGLMATYGGSPAFATSGSSTLNVTVGAASIPTTTGLSATASSVQSGQPITFTVTVTPNSGSQTPGGSATVMDGSTQLGMVTLDALGKGALSTSSLAVGSHSITASYTGGTGFGASGSGTVSVTVTSATTNSHSGGGAMDACTLASLGTLWLLVALIRPRRIRGWRSREVLRDQGCHNPQHL
jgi:hypothetical protein